MGLLRAQLSSNVKRWRWYKFPDLYHYQHVSDVRFSSIFALLMRLETQKCWYKSGDLYQPRAALSGL